MPQPVHPCQNDNTVLQSTLLLRMWCWQQPPHGVGLCCPILSQKKLFRTKKWDDHPVVFTGVEGKTAWLSTIRTGWGSISLCWCSCNLQQLQHFPLGYFSLFAPEKGNTPPPPAKSEPIIAVALAFVLRLVLSTITCLPTLSYSCICLFTAHLDGFRV